MSLKRADFLADVAAVFSGTSEAGAFGSGRLIAPGLVLTAGHVVDYPNRNTPDRGNWKIRLLRERKEDGAWTDAPHDAELLWRGQDELDLALLRIQSDLKPLLTPVITSYDQVGVIEDVEGTGFPEAWYSAEGNLRDYTATGRLRLAAQHGPYVWTIPSGDKPDDPRQWRGMSGAALCYVGSADKLYLFGTVQQVPANFSGGMLEIARISEGMSDSDFLFHLQNALGEKPALVPWDQATFLYGFSQSEFAQLVERLKGPAPISQEWMERQESLARQAAVSEAAIRNVARHLGVEGVPVEELGIALIDKIDRLQVSLSQAQALPPDNPIKSFAKEAAESGEYVRAEKLLAVALAQIRAVSLIETRRADDAIAVLNDALQHLDTVSAKSRVDDRITLGYVYKTLAQAYSSKGDKAQADQTIAKAMEIFGALANETRPEGKSRGQFASVMNGTGNLRAAQGQHQDAIIYYKIATSAEPGYAYAWHDMFLSYYHLAKQGEVHLEEMRDALARAKATRMGYPRLDDERFAAFDTMLVEFDKDDKPARNKAKTSKAKSPLSRKRSG